MPQSHLKARQNPDYWDKGKPYVDAIEIRIIPDEGNIIAQLRTGNIHHALLEDNKNYLLMKDDKRLRRSVASRLGFDCLMINMGRKPFDDVRVRQALSLAIDRTEVLQVAASGLGQVTGPSPRHETLGPSDLRPLTNGTRRTWSAPRSCWRRPGIQTGSRLTCAQSRPSRQWWRALK